MPNQVISVARMSTGGFMPNKPRVDITKTKPTWLSKRRWLYMKEQFTAQNPVFYEVENLLAIRKLPYRKDKEILVHWKGYPVSKSTWEPYQKLVEDGFLDEIVKLQNNSCNTENLK